MTTYALLFEGDNPAELAKACNDGKECKLTDSPVFCPFGRNCQAVTAEDWEALAIDLAAREKRTPTPPPTEDNIGEIWWMSDQEHRHMQPVLIDKKPNEFIPSYRMLIYRRIGSQFWGYVADGGLSWYGKVEVPEPAEDEFPEDTSCLD